MTSNTPSPRAIRTWTRGHHFISTDVSLVQIDQLNQWLDSPDIYWAKSLPRHVLIQTLQDSLCFGVYESNDQGEANVMIGIARGVTDFTTFLYLTDVYICPEQQGQGLGKWLIECVQSVIVEMPYLRRSMLFTSDWDRSVPFYQKLMDMSVITSGTREQGAAILQRKGPGFPDGL